MEIGYVILRDVVPKIVLQHALVAAPPKHAASYYTGFVFFKKTKRALYLAAKGSEIRLRQFFMGKHMG